MLIIVLNLYSCCCFNWLRSRPVKIYWLRIPVWIADCFCKPCAVLGLRTRGFQFGFWGLPLPFRFLRTRSSCLLNVYAQPAAFCMCFPAFGFFASSCSAFVNLRKPLVLFAAFISGLMRLSRESCIQSQPLRSGPPGCYACRKRVLRSVNVPGLKMGPRPQMPGLLYLCARPIHRARYIFSVHSVDISFCEAGFSTNVLVIVSSPGPAALLPYSPR